MSTETLRGCPVDTSPALFLMRLFGYMFPRETQFYLFEKTTQEHDLGLPRVVAHNGTHIFDNTTIEGYNQEYLVGPLQKYSLDFDGGAHFIAFIPKHEPTLELMSTLFRLGELDESPGYMLTFLKDYQNLTFSDGECDLPEILKAIPENISSGLLSPRESQAYLSSYDLAGHLRIPCAIRALLETTPRGIVVSMPMQYEASQSGDTLTLGMDKIYIQVFTSLDDHAGLTHADAVDLFERSINALDYQFKMADIIYKDTVRGNKDATECPEYLRRERKRDYYKGFDVLATIVASTSIQWTSDTKSLQGAYDLQFDFEKFITTKERIENEATRLCGQEEQGGAGDPTVSQTWRERHDSYLSLLRQRQELFGDAG